MFDIEVSQAPFHCNARICVVLYVISRSPKLTTQRVYCLNYANANVDSLELGAESDFEVMDEDQELFGVLQKHDEESEALVKKEGTMLLASNGNTIAAVLYYVMNKLFGMKMNKCILILQILF